MTLLEKLSEIDSIQTPVEGEFYIFNPKSRNAFLSAYHTCSRTSLIVLLYLVHEQKPRL